MNKISDEVINFIENTMESWRLKLTAGEKNSTEVKIQKGIFQGDVLSRISLVIIMMPLNQIIRKNIGGYKQIVNQK